MKVLLDTSVWINHFKSSNEHAVELLESDLAVSHEFVVAELACGSLKSRKETIGLLQALVSLPTLPVDDVMTLIEARSLYSRGIGLVDVQLLASSLVTPDTQLWTLNKRLHEIALELDIGFLPE